MPKAKQFSVSHENRPGMLAEIAKALGDQKVNILSCLTTTSGTEGTTHLLVDNVNRARKALASAQLSYTEADVLHVELFGCHERRRPSCSGNLQIFVRISAHNLRELACPKNHFQPPGVVPCTTPPMSRPLTPRWQESSTH